MSIIFEAVYITPEIFNTYDIILKILLKIHLLKSSNIFCHIIPADCNPKICNGVDFFHSASV